MRRSEIFQIIVKNYKIDTKFTKDHLLVIYTYLALCQLLQNFFV